MYHDLHKKILKKRISNQIIIISALFCVYKGGMLQLLFYFIYRIKLKFFTDSFNEPIKCRNVWIKNIFLFII